MSLNSSQLVITAIQASVRSLSLQGAFNRGTISFQFMPSEWEQQPPWKPWKHCQSTWDMHFVRFQITLDDSVAVRQDFLRKNYKELKRQRQDKCPEREATLPDTPERCNEYFDVSLFKYVLQLQAHHCVWQDANWECSIVNAWYPLVSRVIYTLMYTWHDTIFIHI